MRMTVTQSSERLTVRDIERFLETKAPEDTTLEFKQAVYEKSDKGKKEFVKDVTAFANSQGGHLVIGVIEKERCATALNPLKGIDLDAEMQRLQNLCNTRVVPLITGVDIYCIDVDGGALLAVKVPKSPTAPHQAKSEKSKTFHQRHSNCTSEMDVSQLREAFTKSTTAENKAAELSRLWAYTLDERINASVLQEASKKGTNKIELAGMDGSEFDSKDGVVALHIIPIGSIFERTSFTIEAIRQSEGLFAPLTVRGYKEEIDVDRVTYYNNEHDINHLTQVHRTGALEIVSEGFIREPHTRRELLGLKISAALKDQLPRYLKGLRKLGATPPLFVKMRILRASNSEMDTGGRLAYFSGTDRHLGDCTIELPSVLVVDYPTECEIDRIGKKILDPLWNAYGRAKCPCFDDSGKWLSIS